MHAIDFGTMDELRAKHPDAILPSFETMPNSSVTATNLLMKPNLMLALAAQMAKC
ncbi:hypothetical protein ACROAE_19635 [Shewanella sp. MF05960]|uniref:hypothetical protein n=1 Tax=Shewanella sp. MF05960 TaxID=3434874 RepID=UPI003D792EC6